MKAMIVIPARHASSRYPGKPLAELRLPGGGRKPLIRLTWEAALAVRGVAEVLVATDDTRIARVAEGFGASVVLTSPQCSNGTERCAEAIERARVTADLVVNLQGDAPLTPPWFVEALLDEMARDPAVRMATPVLRCGAESLARLRDDRQAGRVGATTAVFAHSGDALYFSKEVIPFNGHGDAPVHQHVGVYAFRPEVLRAYPRWQAGPLERAEGLEQLRFLENGVPIRCVPVDARGRQFWELNHPEDVTRIEALLEEQAWAAIPSQ